MRFQNSRKYVDQTAMKTHNAGTSTESYELLAAVLIHTMIPDKNRTGYPSSFTLGVE